MEATHLFALIPLLVLLVLSIIFYGKGLLHITTFSYALCLTFMAIANNWEIMFFPLIIGTILITIILFIYAMANGNWL